MGNKVVGKVLYTELRGMIGIPKGKGEQLKAFFDKVEALVKEGKQVQTPIGIFKPVEREGIGQNPKTGEKVSYKRKGMAFIISQAVRVRLNNE